jgi:hypothetical protein
LPLASQDASRFSLLSYVHEGDGSFLTHVDLVIFGYNFEDRMGGFAIDVLPAGGVP